MKRWRLFACVFGVLVLCAACRQSGEASAQSPNSPSSGREQAQSVATTPTPTQQEQLQGADAAPFTGVVVATRPGGAAKAGIGGQAAQLEQSQQQNPNQQRTNPAAQGPPPPLEDAEKKLGPFALAPGQDFFVVIHSKRLQTQPGKFDEAAAWAEIRDAAGAVQYHEDFPYTVEGGSFNEQCWVGAEMLAGNNGKGLMIDSECVPSAPLGGGSWQVFGFVHGKIVPFGKPLFVEGEMERFVPGAITKQGQATIFSADMIEFKVFTGNVFVVLPLRIDWMNGRLEPGMRCLEQSGHGAVESGCEVPVADVERVPGGEMTFVRLFPEANEQMIPAHVVVRKESKVEVLAAKVRESLGEDRSSLGLGVDGEVWLKVRIDGKEGWIHSQEDFEAIGLLQSG